MRLAQLGRGASVLGLTARASGRETCPPASRSSIIARALGVGPGDMFAGLAQLVAPTRAGVGPGDMFAARLDACPYSAPTAIASTCRSGLSASPKTSDAPAEPPHCRRGHPVLDRPRNMSTGLARHPQPGAVRRGVVLRPPARASGTLATLGSRRSTTARGDGETGRASPVSRSGGASPTGSRSGPPRAPAKHCPARAPDPRRRSPGTAGAGVAAAPARFPPTRARVASRRKNHGRDCGARPV